LDKELLPDVDSTNRLEELVESLEVPLQRIFEVYDKDDGFVTIVNPTGGNIKERIQNTAILTLYGHYLFFGQKEVLAQEIRRNLSENKISDSNFWKHLDELSPRHLRTGKSPRNPRTPCRITELGLQRARGLIRGILGESPTGSGLRVGNVSSLEELLENNDLWVSCRASFENGEYWDACANAFRHLEIRIRDKCELTAEDYGVVLITRAFRLERGILKIPSCEALGEEEGFYFILRGIMQFHRNAKVHRKEDMREVDATRIICYVDYLLDVVETSVRRG
jgi:uncharacterized protein (TIGR02391 family)